MKNIIRVLFAILLFLTEETLAYDPVEGQVTATLGPYFSRTNFGPLDSRLNTSYKPGTALIAVGDINEKASLEISMFYLPQMFFRQQDGKLISEKTQLMHIGMGYRRWWNHYFSTSLAFYSSYSMGDPKIVYSDFTPGTEINTSARDITEYGFDLSAQGDLWNSKLFTLVFETRYSLSVTSKPGEKSDQYGFLLGLRYMVQEEKRVESRPR